MRLRQKHHLRKLGAFPATFRLNVNGGLRLLQSALRTSLPKGSRPPPMALKPKRPHPIDKTRRYRHSAQELHAG